MSRTGKLYIGAAYAGHLLCFDPDEEALEDLGPINSGAVVFPLDPSALSLEVVVMAEGAFAVPGPILGRHIYFATGHRLRLRRCSEDGLDNTTVLMYIKIVVR